MHRTKEKTQIGLPKEGHFGPLSALCLCSELVQRSLGLMHDYTKMLQR